MKKEFRSIQEWLDSNPPKELVSKMLEDINISIHRENRKLIKEKQRELEGITNTIRRMDRYLLPISPDIKKKISDLVKEIDTIKKSIPQSKYNPTPRKKKE
jgi:hypothetical protein